MMKDFFWQYFSTTGNVNAYLMYKDTDDQPDEANMLEEASEEDVPHLQ